MSHILSLDQCPLQAPFSILNGHYCCVSPDDSCDDPLHLDDLLPCTRPPCKTNPAILRGETMTCPTSHKFSLHKGRFCCSTETATDACGQRPLDDGTAKSCCVDADLFVCPVAECHSGPGEMICYVMCVPKLWPLYSYFPSF